MKKIFCLLFVALICIQDFAECKRTVSGGSRKTSSSSNSYSTRRQSSYATSRPATSRPISSNSDNTRLSYGNSYSQPKKPSAPAPDYNKPAGAPTITRNPAPPTYRPLNNANHNAPPAYSPINNPSSISRNQAPPPYSQNVPGGHNTLQSSSYPRQTYQPGQLPPGATMYSGPPGMGGHGQPSYYQPGHAPAGANMYPGPPSYMHQSPPSYYSPGHLPPGAVLYPAGQMPKQSSGPGLGTGLVAGAIGGAILGHVLTPTHTGGDYAQRTGSVSQPAPDSDRIIIINNGPPGSVTTTNGAGTTVIDHTGSAAAVAPAAAPAVAHPDPATPLAPFQPGSTQEVNNQHNANSQMAPAAVAAPIAAGAVMSEPIAANNQTAQAGPQPGSVVCYPIMVNQTDPADPTKQKEVEQIACYEVPQNPPLAPLDQQNTSQQPSAEQSQMINNPAPAVTTIENYTQKTSSATVAQSAQIKQSGALNLIPVSFWSTVTFAVVISCSKLLIS